MEKFKKYRKFLFTALLAVLCLISLLISLLIPGGKAPETTAPTTIPATTKPAVNNSTSLRPGPKLKAHFIDGGQADSILLECEGSYALIDAGYPQSGKIVVDYLKELGVSRLDLVVGTHPHGDHIGGLPKVLKEFKADNIWSGPIPYYNSTVYDFLNAAEAQNEEVQYVKPGTTFKLGGATIEVLGPVKDNYEDVNDLSLVLMVTYGDIKYLLTGDMETIAEKDLIASGAELKAPAEGGSPRQLLFQQLCVPAGGAAHLRRDHVRPEQRLRPPPRCRSGSAAECRCEYLPGGSDGHCHCHHRR